MRAPGTRSWIACPFAIGTRLSASPWITSVGHVTFFASSVTSLLSQPLRPQSTSSPLAAQP
jgi:hypothetical protein